MLGSATPSVESYYSALTNKIGLVKLEERFGESKVPKINPIDFKEAQNLKTTNGSFTIQMIMEIERAAGAEEAGYYSAQPSWICQCNRMRKLWLHTIL